MIKYKFKYNDLDHKYIGWDFIIASDESDATIQAKQWIKATGYNLVLLSVDQVG